MCIILMYRAVQRIIEHIINFLSKCVSKGAHQMLFNNQSSPHMQRNQTVDLDLKLSYVQKSEMITGVIGLLKRAPSFHLHHPGRWQQFFIRSSWPHVRFLRLYEACQCRMLK